MNKQELDSIALWLYEYNVNDWDKFTDEELLILASLCQITKENPYGRSYDDEVFDEMERRGIKYEQ